MNDSKLLFTGSRFRVVRAEQTLDDGTVHVKEIVRHPGAVVILPLLDDGRICLIRNYRLSVDKTLIELPAGTLEPNEDTDVTARRELLEETGYRAANIELLGAFYPSPGVLDERMRFYLATGLAAGPTDLQPGENIEPLLVTWDQALAMIRDKEIEDAKTLAGLLYYHTFRRGQ